MAVPSRASNHELQRLSRCVLCSCPIRSATQATKSPEQLEGRLFVPQHQSANVHKHGAKKLRSQKIVVEVDIQQAERTRI